MSTSRFENGVTNQKPGMPLADMGQLDPTLFLSYFNDFTAFNSADWTKTATGAATAALESGYGGLLLITNSAGGTDLCSLQQATASFGILSVPPALDTWFVAQFALSDAVNTQLAIGLQEINANPFAATDGLWFQKAAATTNLDFHCMASSTDNPILDIAQLANTTMVSVGFYLAQTKQRIKLFVNGLQVPGIDKPLPTLTSANLALVMAIKNADAVANTLTIDYIGAFTDRPQVNDPSYAGRMAGYWGDQMGNLAG
jgi:hypothetical protein